MTSQFVLDTLSEPAVVRRWRTNDRDQLAKVLGVGKAVQQPADQLSFFDDVEEETA